MRTYRSDGGDAAMVRLETGEDLYDGLAQAVTDLGFRAGTVQVIGAVSNLVLGYYEQSAKEYRTLEPEGHWEIAAGLGNVSMKDGEPFLHLHVVATGEDGSAVGGHLKPGSTVFAAEAYLRALGGDPPVREPDGETGLDLWG